MVYSALSIPEEAIVRNLFWAVAATLALSSCASKPCKQLASQVCEAAPGTRACETAGRLTIQDECLGYLANVPRYIELANEEIGTPTRKPPAVEAAPAPAAEAAPAPAGETAPPAPAAAPR